MGDGAAHDERHARVPANRDDVHASGVIRFGYEPQHAVEVL